MHFWSKRTAAAVLVALAALAPTAAQAADETPAPEPEAKTTRLSDEMTLSRWAYTNLSSKIRANHSSRSRGVGKLRFNTEDGPPEVYLALRLYEDVKGNQWVEIRIPQRPNGKTGWVPREALGEFHVVTKRLVVNRRTLKATLFNRGRKIFETRVGVGKASTPTPGGRFWIRERLHGFGNPVYGPIAFGTAAYSKISDWPGGGVVGIHGTNEPQLIPGRPSHGCIRMKNPAILRLAKLMPIGTPLQIV